jgi:cytochrome c-type biogenesis protein CcmH
MTAQWLFLGIALAATLTALVWVLAPVRQSNARLGWVAALAVPTIAMSAYMQLGAPKALAVAAQEPPHALRQADMASMVAGLQRKLQEHPGDVAGWFMLARSRAAMAQWAESAAAYRRALALVPSDPDLMADLADVLAVMADGELEGEPRALIDAALKVDPAHAKARALLASAEFRQGRLVQAASHWEAMLKTAPSGSEAADVARQGLQRVRALTASTAGAPPGPEATARK